MEAIAVVGVLIFWAAVIYFVLTRFFKETGVVILRILKYNFVVVFVLGFATLIFGLDAVLLFVTLQWDTIELFVLGMVLVDSLFHIEKATKTMARVSVATMNNTLDISQVENNSATQGDTPLQRETPPQQIVRSEVKPTAETSKEDMTADKANFLRLVFLIVVGIVLIVTFTLIT